MESFQLNPADYVMKGNPPKAIPNPSPIKPMEIDPTDSEAVKAMVWDKLVAIASTIAPNAQALPILREIMDRIEGKPVSRTDIHAKVLSANVDTDKVIADRMIEANGKAMKWLGTLNLLVDNEDKTV